MAGVMLKKVNKRFGRTEVIRELDLTVKDGEFLVVVGPSGCGKSTVLRLIAGLEEVSGGEVFIGRDMVNRHEPRERNVAMVFQNYALYPHMNVFGNLAYGLKVRGQAKADIKRRVEEVAQLLGLKDLLQRKPRQLSGGQRQRVAMGRAMVRDPSVFLLDEPLSNLDAKLRNQMRLELKRLHRRLKSTFVYVTHDQVEAMTLGERILVINQGRVEQLGAPQDIYGRPASAFVAGFMGSPPMNLWPGHLLPGEGRVLLGGGERGNGARPVTVGVRPEHVCLDRPSRDGAVSLVARVDMVEPLGGEVIVHCHAPACQPGVVLRVPPEHRVEHGQTMRLWIEPDRLHLFEADNGGRIDGNTGFSLVLEDVPSVAAESA